MSKTVLEYIDYLQDKPGLIWPKPPRPVPMKAAPFLKPIEGIRAVTWEVYGTLLSIDHGHLLHAHPQQLRMQVALEKTIQEFNMWYSMARKPGQPWEYMLKQYTGVLEDFQMAGSKKKGDFTEVNSVRVWHKLIDRLQRNEYTYDETFFGDLDGLATKVAYFFHANLQGVAAAANACETLKLLTAMGIRQALVADAQPFTLAQLVAALRTQSQIVGLNEILSTAFQTFSCDLGVRKPSPTLFEIAAQRFRDSHIAPEQVLHVSHRLQDDLAPARRAGFKTALLASDANYCHFTNDEIRDPQYRPDRLITDIKQVVDIVQT